MRNYILAVLAVILLAGSAAAFTPGDYSRCPDGSGVAATVTGVTAEWTKACAVFTWNGVSDIDFNNYVITTTSNVSAFDGLDENLTVNTKTLCTLPSSGWVKMIVYRVDGNADGYCLNELPDGNYTLTAGSVTNAGLYLFYAVLAAIASLAALIILVVVLSVMLKKIGFGNILKFK